jgi:single-strand DNA-binding protein
MNMRGMNQITIVGNVGQVNEMKYLQSGVPVMSFTVAVNKTWGQGEDKKESTTWFKVTMWRQLAENLHSYIKKGDPILVTGEVSGEVYPKQDGTPGMSLVVTADKIILLGSKNGNGAPPAPEGNVEF